MELIQFLVDGGLHGFGFTEPLLFLNRVVVGAFFLISGYHKLFVPIRHEQLVRTLEACGIPFLGFCCWFVPIVEFLGGIAVFLGLLAPLAAIPLMILLLVALVTDGPRRIREFQPLDKADLFDDILYLPETTYLLMLIFILFIGPGHYTLQAPIEQWLMSP